MEDAHATVLDLQADDGTVTKPSTPESRLSFFGVYDGHGGDRVAQFAGENIHHIIAKQEAFKKGDIEQALKDGFLATDRAILNGQSVRTNVINRRLTSTSQTLGILKKSPDALPLLALSLQRRSTW